MSPIAQQMKKEEEATKAVHAELSAALQTRGMDTGSLMGRPEIKGIIGEAGKAPDNAVQKTARSMTKAFLERSGLLKAPLAKTSSAGKPVEKKVETKK